MTISLPFLVGPDLSAARLVVDPPGQGPGYWAGAPWAVFADGWFYLAYRLRDGTGQRGHLVVVARSKDGLEFETLATLPKEAFGAASLERPALAKAPDGTWHLYVSCATPGNFHWWVDLLVAPDPESFNPDQRRTVLPGDSTTAVKDPVVAVDDGQWRLWACIHPLDDPRATDRMYSRYAESADGVHWDFLGDALAGPPDSWDSRGRRVACVIRSGPGWMAFYDGRPSAESDAEEKTGLAFGPNPFGLESTSESAAYASPWGSGSLRYVSIAEGPGGGPGRFFFEACLADGSHGLFTQVLRPSSG
jgi:hypothetical protein